MGIIPAPEWMIIDSIRYAIGRRTYQVSVTCGWIRCNWNNLPTSVKAVIEQDVESEFERAERLGKYDHLGDKCDTEDWKSVRSLWRNND